MNFLFEHFIFIEIAGITAGVLSFVAYIPYIYSILIKKTKPSRSSWWIWSLVGLLVLFSYYTIGARTTIWVPAVFFICPLVVAILSLKFGEGNSFNKTDKICLYAAALSILVWFFSKSALIALYINILIDSLGYLPTFKKTYINPKHENKTCWILFLIGSILNMLAISDLSFSIALYPFYMFAMDIVMIYLLFRKNT